MLRLTQVRFVQIIPTSALLEHLSAPPPDILHFVTHGHPVVQNSFCEHAGNFIEVETLFNPVILFVGRGNRSA